MVLDEKLTRPLSAVRRRLRLQAALEGATRASVASAALVLVGVYLWRLGAVGERGLWRVLLLALALPVVAALVRAARRIPLQRVAQRIDASHALHDRLGSALAFAGEAEPTPFMRAAIADAERVAPTVEPRRAAPWRRPHGLGLLAALGAVAAGVAILQFPQAEPRVQPAPPRVPRLAVADDALEPEREAVRELEREATATDDAELKEQTAELNKLLEQVQNEELTRKQVFDKLSELEKKAMQPEGGDFEELKRALKKAGLELSKDKLTREAGNALAKEDLEQAKKELEKLAAEAEKLAAEKKQLPDQERQELARTLKRAGEMDKEQSAEEKKRAEEERKLKEEERRLKRELAQKPNDQELQRKLQRNERELKRLEREKRERAEQQRQLQRLQRELQKAAEQLWQKLSPEAAQALREAARQLGQMQNEIKKLQVGQRMQAQLGEIKEVLRRVGRSSNGGQPGGSGKDGRMARLGKSGPKHGKNGGGDQRMRDFDQRAGGGKDVIIEDDSGDVRLPGDRKKDIVILGEGNQSILLPVPTAGGSRPGQRSSDDPGGRPGSTPTNRPGANPGDQAGGPPGDGIGDQHDPNLMGDPTKIASQRKDTRVAGKEGAGPSRSETILGSAEKGFATRAYRRVYGDYTAVMEEVMSKEKVPPGYRFYVKRYFQLIKPRE